MALAASVLVRIAAQAKDFNRTLNRVEKKLEGFQKTSRRVSRGTIAAFAGLAPAITPIGAAAVGAAGAIAASFASASVALAGFGAVAVSVLKDVFEVSEDIEKINEKIEKAQALGDQKKVNKLLKEREHILSKLSKEQRRAADALADFKDFWEDFAKSFEKPVIDIFIKSLNILKRTIKGLEPSFRAAMNAIDRMMDRLGEATQAKGFQDFFKWMETSAGPAVESFGNTAMNIIGGVMNLLMAFDPITKDVQDGLEGMSKKFLEWSQSLKGSESFKSFLDYVRANGPKVVNILRNIARLGRDIMAAFAPLGSVVLKSLDKLLQGLADNVGPLIKKVAEGFKKSDPKIIGNAIVDVINKATSSIQGMMKKINWEQVAKAIGTGIGLIGEYAGTIIPGVVSAFQKVMSQIPWDKIAGTIGAQAGKIAPHFAIALVAIIDAMIISLPIIMPALFRFAYEFANAAANAIFDPATWKPLWERHGWWLIVDLIGLIFMPARWARAIFGAVSKIPIIGPILAWLGTSLNNLGGPARAKVKAKFDEILKGAKDGFAKRWPEIRTWLITQATRLADWLKSHAQKFREAAANWATKIKDGIKNLPGQLLQSGKNAVDQLIRGLKSKLGDVGAAAKKIADKVKQYIGWSSPTEKGPGRTSHKWAPNLVKMFAGGLVKGVPRIERAATNAATASRGIAHGGDTPKMDKSGGTIGASISSGGGRPVNVTINNYTDDKRTAQSIEKAVLRGLWMSG